MAQCILMKTGGVNPKGNAQPNDVREGKTFMNESGKELTGALPVRVWAESNNASFWNNSIYISQIPEGIYQKGDVINEPQVCAPAHLFGNAKASDVRQGITFTSSSGMNIPGSMPVTNTNLIAFGGCINWENKTMQAPLEFVDTSIGERSEDWRWFRFKRPTRCIVFAQHFHPDQGNIDGGIDSAVNGSQWVPMTLGYNRDQVGVFSTSKEFVYNTNDTFQLDITCVRGACGIIYFAVYEVK